MRRLVLAGIASVLILVPAPAQAKSFEFPAVAINVFIQEDGSFIVREERTFAFDGDFRRAFLTIPRGPWSIGGVSVAEGNNDYRPVRSAGSEAPGTFAFNVADTYEIRWFYRARDERRTFTITYTVSDHIVAYRDVAEMFWKFIGDEWDVPHRNVTVNVFPPAPARDVRVWGHGPLEGEVTRELDDDDRVRFATWRVASLPARTFLEGRMTFPSRLVPGAPRQPGDRLPAVLDEERALADEANAARVAARFWNIGAPAAAFASFLLFLFLFFRFGKEPDAPHPGEYLREPPADYPPAIVGHLMRFGSVTTLDMVSTVMDLARRGYLTIDEVREDTGFLRRKTEYRYTLTVAKQAGDELYPYERDVLVMLREAGADDGLPDDDLERWAEANPKRMQSWFSTFTEGVKAHARRLGLVEPRAWLMSLNVAIAVLAGLVAVVAINRQVRGGTFDDLVRFAPGAIVAFVILVIQIAFTRVLRRRTFNGAVHHGRWQAFRRFLKDFSRIDEYRPTAVTMWERYLVYAIPLDAAKEVTEALALKAPPEVAETGFRWYAFSPRDGAPSFNAFTASIGSFTSSFTASTSAAFATAPSSGRGFGGGFSGGGGSSGGGGGGGGGGGAS